MPPARFNRRELAFRPLAERENRVHVPADCVDPEAPAPPLSAAATPAIRETAARLRQARAAGRPRLLAFGAHTIKNGLGPVLIRLLRDGWVTHLATNGAGVIHDWELAYQGQTSEDVRANVARGQFGLWEETGAWINLALLVGAWDGLGYGESVGRLIQEDGLDIPTIQALAARDDGAARDLRDALEKFRLNPGRASVQHPYKHASVQAAAYALDVPFTSHPMFGHDIIYCHPLCCGAAIGRTAERDFLAFAEAVSALSGGVYVSVGSAVMSPMVFEKCFSMAQNLAKQRGTPITGHFLTVVDIAPVLWDWQADGEPPPDHPAYYQRYCKTFSRMGGTMRYIAADNRAFFLALLAELKDAASPSA